MIPEQHQVFVEKCSEILKKDIRITGIAVGGSYIDGNMDEYSDLDIVIVTKDSYYHEVFEQRFEITHSLGPVLSAFTGEHVGEPRLIICLYKEPLLHVDLKFVSLKDFHKRVEDPVIIWERTSELSCALQLNKSEFPAPDLQWIEDRFWVWVHYGAVKIGRKELFEALDFLSFLRQTVIGPLLQLKYNQQPRGVRRIEKTAYAELPQLISTIAGHSAVSCAESLKNTVNLYIDLRKHFADETFVYRIEAEKYTNEYLNEIAANA